MLKTGADLLILFQALYEDDIESIEMSTALLQVCKPSPQISQALGKLLYY